LAWYIPILIFVARIADVSLGTVRTVFVVSGHRKESVALGFLEIVIWVYASGSAFKYLGEWTAVIGYAGGYASGVAIGMWLERKIAIGLRGVTVMNPDQSLDVSTAMRKRGYRVTRMEGHGMMGPVEIAYCVVKRRNLPKLREVLREVAPKAFVTTERIDRADNSEQNGSRFARAFGERMFPLRK
jgi:uncharacterized protein YebE (UPF0316 family)